MQEEFRTFLICRNGTRFCGIPIEHVVETMRALPVETFAGSAQFVLGLSRIRGVMTPVIDIAELMGLPAAGAAERFVTVRAGHRTVAVAVQGVTGLRQLPATVSDDFPPLLGKPDIASAVATLDARLMVVLNASRVIPDSDWPEIDRLVSVGALHD